MLVFDLGSDYLEDESDYSDCGETAQSDSLEISDRYRNGSISPTLSSVSKHESLSLSSKIIPEDVSMDSERSSLRNKDGSLSNGIGKCSPEESIRQKIVRSKGSLKHLCKRSSESALNKKGCHDGEHVRHFSHTSLNRLARENEARKTSAPDLKAYATYLSRRCSLDSMEIKKLARDRIFHLGHSFHAGDKKTIEEYPIPIPNNEESSTTKQNGVGSKFSGIFRRRSGSSKSLGRKPNHHSESKLDSEGSRLKRHASFNGIKRSNSFSNDREVLKERDKAIEEWGRAASKCEELIEELECTLTELILIKCDRDEKEQELHNVMAFYEHNMDERDEKIIELNEQLNVAGEKIDVARRERTEAYEQRDELLQHSYKYAQEVEAMKNGEVKHKEIERNLLEQIKSFEDQVATLRSERDHAVTLWKETMEERKRVYDEQIVLAQAKDEALQKTFLQIEEINVLKTERDQLLRQIENSQLFNGYTNEEKISQQKSDSGFLSTLKMKHEESTSENHGNDSLQLSTEKFGDDDTSDVISNGEEYEDIAICMDTLDSRVGWKLDNAIDAPRVMVSLVTPQAEQKWNIKKHDRILSVNSTSVQRANKKTVERLIRDAPGRTISLVLRREKPNTTGVRQYADVDLGMAKQNNFLGLQCSLQIKQIQANSELSGAEYLKEGDIITKINAQDTSEIVSSMILKLVKKWNGRATFRVKREGGFLEDKLNVNQQENLSKRSSQFQNSLFNFTLRRKSSGTSSDISTPKSSIFTDISSLFSYSSDIRNVSDDIGLDNGKEKSVTSFRSTENIQKDVKLRLNSDSVSTQAQKETNRLSITTIHNSLENINDSASVPLRDVAVRSSLRNKLRLQSLGATIGKNFSRNWLHASAREKCVSGAVEFDDSDPNLNSPCLYQLSRYATLPRSYQRKPYGYDGRLSTRIIRIEKDEEDPIGFDICGGNKIGIYVKNLSPASVSEGLQIGDRLMSINTTDLSKATLDFAMRVMLLHRSYTHIRVEVKHYPNFDELMENEPYESVYVRCLQPHSARNNNEISFDVGTILHVTNTVVNYDEKNMTWCWYGERTKKNLFKDSITKGIIPWIEPYTEEAILRTALTNSFEHLNDKRKRRTFVKTAQDLKKWLSRKPSWGRRKHTESKTSQDTSKPHLYYEILLEEQVNV